MTPRSVWLSLRRHLLSSEEEREIRGVDFRVVYCLFPAVSLAPIATTTITETALIVVVSYHHSRQSRDAKYRYNIDVYCLGNGDNNWPHLCDLHP